MTLLRSAVNELRLVGVALQFLTRVPVPLTAFDPRWLHASARHFPLVGALVGAVAALVLWGAAAFWPPGVAVLLSMAASAWLTGAFHEDGLADTCDGLGGAATRERALAIMKDSRLGSYGALGLGLTLALKATALTALVDLSLSAALAASVLAHGVSRACAVAVLGLLPYAGDVAHAKAKPLARPAGTAAPLMAAAWTLGLGAALTIAAPLTPLRCALAIACALGVAAVCARWFVRRLGGYTGDTLGGIQQWSELAVYLVLALRGLDG
jgi:adenosylcobinamide-GDP ribazoletransferase